MNYSHKKHAIIGMGKTGISIAQFLTDRGEQCEAFDENAITLPKELVLPLHIGSLKYKNIQDFTHIWLSPGIPWKHPALQQARESKQQVQGDLNLFLEYCSAPLLAITGTNGKTTTTHVTQTLLETLPGGCEMGGNIGTPMLNLIDQIQAEGRVALELSSFQLQRSHHIKPRWAVLLNIQADHADMHSSEEEYLTAKLNIFKHQSEGDTAMLPVDKRWNRLCDDLQSRKVKTHRFGTLAHDHPASMQLSAGIITQDGQATLFWLQDDKRQQIACADIPTRGLHQHINLAVAAQAAADFGVDSCVIHAAISSFRGLPHRLRYLGHIQGHDWFDDSKATNPAAAQAALTSFDKTIWICGGLPKGLDLSSLVTDIRLHVEHAVIIGKNCEPYVALLQEAGIAYSVATHIEKAVQLAAQFNNQLPVLLSPAAASQDQFKSYAERGLDYQKAIKALEVKTDAR